MGERLHEILAMDEERSLAESPRRARQGSRPIHRHDRLDHDSGSPRRRRRQRGGSEEIGASRGGLGTKIHAVVDASGLPIAFALSEGQAADITMAQPLLDEFVEAVVIADKGYDSDALAESLEERGCRVIIPPRSRRNHPRRFARSERRLYRQRHRVECFFQRLKRFRRVGTRYEKRAAKFLAMILLASCLLWTL